MATIADNILGSKTTQPKKHITAPPFAGPGSGHVPAALASVIESRPDRLVSCVDVPSFIQRSQYKSYTGPAATSLGSLTNHSYVTADSVPQGRYWVLLYASMAEVGADTDSGGIYPGLWMLPPGPLPAPNISPYVDNPQVFADVQAVAGQRANGPPVLRGIRIDEWFPSISEDGMDAQAEVALIKTRRILIPQSWTLLGYGGGNGSTLGGALGEQWRLNILYSEFLLDEDSEVE